MNQEVTDYIQGLDQQWQIDASNRIREMVHRVIPSVTERIQYRKPHFLKDGQYAAVISPAKEWLSFMIFNSGSLEAPNGFFQPGGSPDRKNVRIYKDREFDYDLLEKLLKEAAG